MLNLYQSFATKNLSFGFRGESGNVFRQILTFFGGRMSQTEPKVVKRTNLRVYLHIIIYA